MRHVAAPEPFLAGRQVQSCGTHGGISALPSREVGSGAMGHVEALEPSQVGRHDPEPLDTWRCLEPHDMC
jgi:hypothetical protein